ncbi:hypothetical protein SCOR_11010 [Sulfidibacter corallicola]|uniref:Uncharacterized protein n=1 Tax=Sulfidibacter corallicola TaxID=2818388 RepID=A0A8A4TG01_SULCO|nr:hypothetical protein [Sulfidibacter corallicola]QTD48134.1 hypothetical protein J3U87_21320 [Sulfidibacter corallicola]
MSRLPVIANLDPYRRMLRVASFIATSLIMALCVGDLLFRGTPLQAFDIQNLTGFALTLATALVLRWTTPSDNPVAQTLTRGATTLAIWLLGLALLPATGLGMYILAAPACYFLACNELKRSGPASEADRWAAMSLFALTLATIAARVALHFLLQTADSQLANLAGDAPVLVLSGLGLLRLCRWLRRGAISLMGTGLAGLGLIWATSSLAGDTFADPPATLVAILTIHAVMALALWPPTLPTWLSRFTGLDGSEARRYRLGVYILGNAALQSFAAFLLVQGPGALVTLGLSMLISAGWMHAYRGRMTAIWFVQSGLFLFPANASLQVPAPNAVVFGALTLLLVVSVALRRRFGDRAMPWIPNWAFSVVFVAALSQAIAAGFPSPMTLLHTGILTTLWAVLPQRPWTRAPLRLTLLGWIPISCFALTCLNRGFDLGWLALWSLCVAAPVLLLPLVRGERYADERREALMAAHGWVIAAVAIGATVFFLDMPAFATGLSEFVMLVAVLTITTGFFLQRARRGEPDIAAWSARATEVGLWLLVGLIRWRLDQNDTLQLGTPLDAYLLLGVGAVAAGIREVLQRGRHRLTATMARASHLYALLGWGYMMWLGLGNADHHHAEIVSLLMAGMYFAFSKTQHRRLMLAAAGFANIALGMWLSRSGFDHTLFYLVPVAASVLALSQMFRDELDERQLKAIRLVTSLVLLCVSAFYNLIDFRDSIWFPVGAALISALGVVAGISLRIRIYLFLGVGFFLLNTVTTLVHVVMIQPPGAIKLFIGVVFLALGCLFTGSFLVFQMKRQELLRRYQTLRLELSKWD